MTWQHFIVPLSWAWVLLIWYYDERRAQRHWNLVTRWRGDRAKTNAEDEAWLRVRRWIESETNRPR